MQAHASKLAKDPEASDNRFKGFDEFMASAKAHAATKAEPAPEAEAARMAEEEDQPYSPSKGLTDDESDQPDLGTLIGSSGNLARKEVCSVWLLLTWVWRHHDLLWKQTQWSGA